VVILDGAMGTELQRRGVPMDRVAWSAAALATHPETVREAHEDYLRAGAEILTANSFGCSRHVLAPAGLGDRVAELNRRSIELAREARDRVAPAHEVWIAGSISSFVPAGEWENTPGPEEGRASYREQAELLAEAGAELLILEMMRDVEQSRQALDAAVATGLPVWVGFTGRLGPDRRTVVLRGRDLERPFEEVLGPVMAGGGSVVAVMHTDMDAVEPALDIVADRWSGPIACYPHSGEWAPPDWQFVDMIAPEDFARAAEGWVARGVQIVGGCCGIGPEYIRLLSERLRGRRPGPRR
jgi:homocysteine S-methyltransferase